MSLHISPRLTLVGAFLFCAPLAESATAPSLLSPEQLADMSMEDLLGTTVSSVSRREEQLAQTPAAAFVLTNEEIRRSGATSIPEALRAVPGLDVARLDNHTWAISSRGFNDEFANKLLVLIDGRTVYTPLFSGVYWDAQDLMLEDVERIEVIRGPGAAVWGANAVNGVINIITKKAAATQGTLVTGGGGSTDRATGAIRYGGKVGDSLHYRVFGKLSDTGDSLRRNGDTADDRWKTQRFGFRVDWDKSLQDLLTLQGDLYQERFHQAYLRLEPVSAFADYVDHHVDKVAGGDLLGRWTHTFSPSSDFVLQTYFDRTVRDQAPVNESRNTFDVDFQQRFSLGDRQTVVLGGDYRWTKDHIGNTFDVSFDPSSRLDELFGGFVHDEIAIYKKRLILTLGSKFESNDYTGFEVQPSARLLWTPTEHQSAWASVSRAVRTPSRAEDDVTIRSGPAIPPGALFRGFPPYVPPSPAIVTTLHGARQFASEKLIAYETGYRVRINDSLSLDLAAFYNEYTDLRSITAANPMLDVTASPAALSFLGANDMRGHTYGGEVSVTARATEWWRLRADYTLLQMDLHVVGAGLSPAQYSAKGVEGSNPQNQFALHSWMDLPWGLEFDTTCRYVDSLSTLDVPSYFAVDVRLGWRPTKNLEFSITGQNLFDRAHAEFAPSFVGSQASQVERSIYGKVTIRF